MALKLPEIDPEECLDYTVEFSDLIPASSSIIDAQVVIESVAPDASPLPDIQYGSPSVFLTNIEPQTSPEPSPLRNDAVIFWVAGVNALVGSNHVFKVLAFDDNIPQRCYVRRVSIKGKAK